MNYINKINKIIANSNITKIILSSTLMLGLFQVPSVTRISNAVLPGPAEAEARELETPLVETFFGNTPTKVSEEIVKKQVAFVSSRKAYDASLRVIEKHADTIKATARAKSVPEDVAIGVAFLENGGSERAVSSAGAAGVYQLMPSTARSLGLTVTKRVDDRMSPAKSIEAGVRYLRSNYERFGDWGLATWAYHAGEGNVTKALRIYAKANHGVSLPGVGQPKPLRAYVEKHDITVHKLLSDKSVQAFTKKLNDDSSGYPYKVVAMSKLFRKASSGKYVTMGPAVF
jgi:hypothetical protein